MVGSSHTTKGLHKKGTARGDRRRTNFSKAVAAPRSQWVHNYTFVHKPPANGGARG